MLFLRWNTVLISRICQIQDILFLELIILFYKVQNNEIYNKKINNNEIYNKKINNNEIYNKKINNNEIGRQLICD